MTKKSSILLSVLLFAAVQLAPAQPSSAQPTSELIQWHDAASLPLFGKAVQDTYSRYSRLPASYESKSRKELWNLGQNSAGLYLRFRTDSKNISLRWTSLQNNWMNHMTPTAIKGLDLYALEPEGWRFVRSARPGKEACSECKVIENMDGKEREYMLYLSLYDGVSSLYLGLDKSAVLLEPAIDSPRSAHPVVMYGTSILQGGCCSRPGMAHTSIISRCLDVECVNLGFSGNAFLDMEIAELMAATPSPSAFVLDYVPNASEKMIKEKGEAFFHILRAAHPEVPVVFVEDVDFPYLAYDIKAREIVYAKNKAQKELFRKLKASGEKRIYYIGAEQISPSDGEGTVDGIHFTDYGMRHYAAALSAVLKQCMRNQ